MGAVFTRRQGYLLKPPTKEQQSAQLKSFPLHRMDTEKTPEERPMKDVTPKKHTKQLSFTEKYKT